MPLFSGYYYSIIFIRGFHKKATALYICDALRDLVALAQFKKRKKRLRPLFSSNFYFFIK